MLLQVLGINGPIKSIDIISIGYVAMGISPISYDLGFLLFNWQTAHICAVCGL